MRKHFTQTQNGLERFWQIEMSGYSILLSFGKTGSIGKRRILNFEKREECSREFQKLVEEKTKQGFQESNRIPSYKILSGDPNFLESWDQIVKSSDRKEALRNHFQFLIETEECKSLLDQILSKITDVNIEEDQLILTLPWSYDEKTPVHLCWQKPFLGKIHTSVPDSMAEFVCLFNGIEIKYDNDDYPTFVIRGIGPDPDSPDQPAVVQEDFGWDEEILEDGDSWWISPLEIVGKSISDVQSLGAFDDSQNWLVYHPFIKNKHGESAISCVDHGICDLEPPIVRYGMGGFLLREICRWIRDINADSDEELSFDGTPIVSRKFQEFMAHKAVQISENDSDVAKRILEFDWHSLAFKIHGTILKWVRSLGKEGAVKEKIRVFDSYWDDAGEIVYLGFDWHAGSDYEDAISEGANVIAYILNFTGFYRSILDNHDSSEISGGEIVEILGDDYNSVRDILAFLSIENFISIAHGKEFKKVNQEEGVYFAYSHYHDEDASVAYHSQKGIEKKFFDEYFPKDEKPKEKKEISEEEQELLDDIFGDVMEDYVGVWKSTMEQSIERLDKNFHENQERYQREFNRILEYREKVTKEEEKERLSDLGMQISSIALNRFLKENKPDVAGWVLNCYHEIYEKLGINTQSLVKGNDSGKMYNTAEYFAGDIIVYIAKYGGGKFLALVENLLPPEIKDSRLAFNLACLNSLEKKRAEMLRYTQIALALGKPKSDFKDRDFDNFREDPEFHALVGH
ncbi:WGR domain-containing protein [Leptospira sp. 201903070]|uniref:WGR domain-containing protein n=1 Tax=Leptospira ainlahdjerensis TaxID=2810033 RepID=A0ABS2UFR7_9LEPT|nr:WGR domain-containing protein [Leptospira ainlahdjerensis]MBM9579209.1 WGR domain-containing protein [Leptospira ainlahdjerensis]